MSDQGNGSGRRPGGNGNGSRFGKPAGERRYGKPAASGERKFGKPVGSGSAGGYGKPAAPGERKFGKPAGGGSGYGKPAAPGERKFGKPAGGGSGYGKPAAPGERKFGKPAGGGERRFAKPSGNRSFGKPSGGRFSAPRRPAAPIAPEPTSGLSMGARRLALDVLRDVHQGGAYASLALQTRLTDSPLSPADKRLATSIVYGTLENQIQIDFALDRLLERQPNDPAQKDILRLSAYQILFLDRVPDSAAVNEGVKLARALGMEGATGFLNAVLRNLVRGKEDIPWPKPGEPDYLRVMTSTPQWIVDRLTAAYGAETAEALLSVRGASHEMVVRPNLMKSDDLQFERALSGKDWTVRRGVAPHAWLVGGTADIRQDDDYRRGLMSIQGQSSMLAAEAVQAKPGMRILDACAAPGGKSCYMAEQMQGTGRVYAWELHEKRALLLESAKRRLRLENLRITVRDALEPKPDFDGTMDAVLLDAPCSGLGVMREKPDLKLRVQEEDVPGIVETQRKLLDTLCHYVKPGGVLVYSTCSLLPEENIEQVRAFQEAHPEFATEPLPLTYPQELRAHQTAYGLQLLSCRDGVESFFIVRMRRARA